MIDPGCVGRLSYLRTRRFKGEDSLAHTSPFTAFYSTFLTDKGEDFLSVFNGKKWWLRFLELKDPGTVLELIAVMELSVVRGAVEPHFVDDFEPAVG